MSKFISINIVRFIGLLLFQVLVLSQVELHGFISPYIYPLFVLLLPLATPKAIVLLLGFLMGLSVDMFTNTPGLHASATVFMAFCRPIILTINYPPGGYESSDRPTIKSMGFKWFFTYTLFAIVLHHLFYFFVEAYSFAYIPFTLLKIAISTLVSLVLIIIYQNIFSD